MITSRYSYIGFLLAIAIFLSGWSVFLSSQSKTSVSEISPNQPDSYIDDAAAIVLNKLGKPTLKIDAPKMIHYPKNDITEVTSPHVIVFRQSPQPWHIRANHATTKFGVSEITFWDHVVINHLADADNPITTMKTSSLTIMPEQSVAKTNEAITLLQPSTKVEAVGMLANWKDGTVKLLSQAREEYVPHP